MIILLPFGVNYWAQKGGSQEVYFYRFQECSTVYAFLHQVPCEVKVKDIREASTNTIAFFGGLAGFVLLWIGILISQKGTGSEFDFYVKTGIAAFVLFFWGCIGLVFIMRKEAPNIVMLRGWAAVFSGLVLVISTWGMTLWALYLIFSHLFERIFIVR